jgi:hypothetical protein
MLAAEKTGNFCMLMPAPPEGTGTMIRAGTFKWVELLVNTYSFINPMSSAAAGWVVRLCVTRMVIISHPYCAEAIQWIYTAEGVHRSHTDTELQYLYAWLENMFE